MNGVHDLGGMDGFGPVDVPAHEPAFQQPWERLAFGLVVAMSAQRLHNTHAFRHAIERMEPTHYLSSPYYEHWLFAVATLLVENGLATRAELAARAGVGVPLAQPMRRAPILTSVPSASTPRFAVGDPIIVRNMHPLGHTRCPRYVRGKRGVVTRVDGSFSLPDVAAHGGGSCKQFTYCVRFDGRELWGDAADAATTISVDLWESYLEAP